MKVEKIFYGQADRTAGTCRRGEAGRGEPRRVAAYCRVSGDGEGQATSFETQTRVYRDKILLHPGWELAGIYADEGISGTSVKHRRGFQQMIEDCEAGKIDYIITKSISRFARNTLECLSYIRRLQQAGVELLFEKENIDTGTAFSEMLLTVLAAFAQEESRSISENLKWGIRKRFEAGIDRWAALYGYEKNEKGAYQPVTGEAAVVREIFDRYDQGSTISEIARELTVRGIPSPGGKERWAGSAVHTILKNEKYVGDVRMQKRYTVDHISHREVVNDCTVVPGYYIRDHHVPLVSRKVYERTQLIRAMRSQGGFASGEPGHTVQYPFGQMLSCPYCGSVLAQKKMAAQKGRRAWFCETGCRRFAIPSELAEKGVLACYGHIYIEEIQQLCLSAGGRQEMEKMLEMKKSHPVFHRVDYYWLDELAERIVFGRHSALPGDGEQDCRITVYWKCGVQTIADTGISRQQDMPGYLAELHENWLARHQDQRGEED